MMKFFTGTSQILPQIVRAFPFRKILAKLCKEVMDVKIHQTFNTVSSVGLNFVLLGGFNDVSLFKI